MTRDPKAPLRFIFAGVISAGIASLVLSMLYGLVLAGPAGFIFGLFFGWSLVPLGLKTASIPAILAGGALWTLGLNRAGARHALVWAGTGAAVGLVVLWILLAYQPVGGSALLAEQPINGFLMAGLFAVTGIICASAFRAAMRLTLLFVPEPEDVST